MSASCLRWMLGHATRTMCGGPAVCLTPASRFNICRARQDIISASWRRSSFSTGGPETEQTPAPKKKKKKSPEASISNVGHRIPHPHIQVISEDGEDLGAMHRANVIRIMNERNLKLVLLSEQKEPPVYRLMSGKQILEEQLKQRETKKVKASNAPVQVKELTLSAGIASHDLRTKLKQVESWLEKKHHIRITLRSKPRDQAANLDTALETMVEQLEVLVGFVSKPSIIRDGQAATCILRPPSKKELMQSKTGKASKAPASESETSSTNSTDTSEETIQH
ncbi:translation initiation factor IF-3, mitochondrial [Gouania willdenowi]|uniref:Translation initiation factor 3 N-terminal domain-containing protein n=1 Tax=Gouania willdenowi TaxID=441366 RepID=A0A8C5N9X3_GOUWI|nr:translation initiation factor IF-3, mitochondrial [Gouania willdenowi]